MTPSEQSTSSRHTVELSSTEWNDILKLLQALTSGGLISLNNPERALLIRDRIVTQLPYRTA